MDLEEAENMNREEKLDLKLFYKSSSGNGNYMMLVCPIQDSCIFWKLR